MQAQKEKPRVQVLLSGYNGAAYIGEQIESILRQEKVSVELLIRDDGSTDETGKILARYAGLHENITVLYGQNVGVIQSFFLLLEAADRNGSYFALADQDDVWLPGKLWRAVEQLEREDTAKPLVYCSAKQLVDERLAPLPSALQYPAVRTEFGNALVENMCTGCTCVLNQTMLLLLRGRQPDFTVMHDFWIYLVGTCFGKVIYDEQSFILYRQHGNNELGAASSVMENYRRRIRNFKRHRGQLGKQAEEFLRLYGEEMPEENKELARLFVRIRPDRRVRKKLIKDRKLFRQRKTDDRIMRLLLAMGLL